MDIVLTMSCQTLATSIDLDVATTIPTEGLSSISMCSSYFRQTSDASVTTHDVVEVAAADAYERDLPKFSGEFVGNNKQDKTHPLSSYNSRRAMTSPESIGPSIMFSSLFGVKDDVVSATVPSVQQ